MCNVACIHLAQCSRAKLPVIARCMLQVMCCKSNKFVLTTWPVLCPFWVSSIFGNGSVVWTFQNMAACAGCVGWTLNELHACVFVALHGKMPVYYILLNAGTCSHD